MYPLISIFYVSLSCIVLMLLFKHREVKTGKPSIISRLGAGTDHIFQAFFSTLRRWFSYLNRRTFLALANWIGFHVLFNVRKVYVDIKDRFIKNPHGKKLIDAVRGRGEVSNHGASFYLRRIAIKDK